jgi:predicted permease
MSWTRVLAARLRGLVGRRRLERELDDEVRFHLEMQIEDNVRAGMPPAQARSAAMRSFGGVEPMKETHRDRRAFPLLETVLKDFHYAGRTLRKSPGFTLTAVLVLALAIGANTAMFSVLHTVLIRPLPFPEPQQLTVLWSEFAPQRVRDLTPARDVGEWRRLSGSFSAMALMDGASVTLTTAGGAERISSDRVSPEYFSILGVQPLHGRLFTAEEAAQRQRLVLLSERLWQTRFGGSADAVGMSVQIDGVPARIIGVLPASFQFPRLSDAHIWEPHTAWQGDSWSVLARLRPNVSVEQAQAEMTAVARRVDEQFPISGRTRGIGVVPLSMHLVGPSQRLAVWLLSGAVLCVLLIAATNVASLSLARGAARGREMTIRAALGASASRIAVQLLAESLTLATLSGVLGLAIAFAILRVIPAVAPAGLVRLDEVRLDPQVLAAASAICMLTGIFVGLAPALTGSRRRTIPLAGRAVAGTASTRRARRALVVTQFALAVVLLAGAGLLIRSLWSVESVRPGFRAERLLSLHVATAFPAEGQRAAFYARVLDELAGLPGVESAGIVSDLFVNGGSEPIVTTERDGARTSARMRFRADEASPGLFTTIGAQLLRGRFFTPADGPTAPPVVVVNETMARRLWPGLDPIGRRFRIGPANDSSVWFTVVGVVADMRRQGIENEPTPQLFQAIAQAPPRLAVLVVRTTAADPLKLAPAVEAAVRRVDRHVPLYGLHTVENRLAADLAPRRFHAGLLIAFSALALLMAAIGIYGLIQYSIATRTQEIGIRIAVGAQSGEIFRMVIGEGVKLSMIGLAIGLAGGLWLGQAGSRLLFGVTPTDPLTFLTVSLILIGVGAAACFFPARRAMKLDPISALRQD